MWSQERRLSGEVIVKVANSGPKGTSQEPSISLPINFLVEPHVSDSLFAKGLNYSRETVSGNFHERNWLEYP